MCLSVIIHYQKKYHRVSAIHTVNNLVMIVFYMFNITYYLLFIVLILLLFRRIMHHCPGRTFGKKMCSKSQ